MRIITAAQKQALEELAAEGLLGGLPVQVAEKDIHVTELLRELSRLEVYHDHFSDLDSRAGELTRHDAGIRLVFAGGTCLSKAYGLVNRMSEDIDIKVVLAPTAKPLKKGRKDRVRLKALHSAIPPVLEQLGFPLLNYADDANPRIRDVHRYYVVGAGYRSAYDNTFSSLRAELKLELIQRTPLLPLEKRSFGYLYEAIAGRNLATEVVIDCVSVAETAAEKVLSLLRRCAYKWDGHQTRGDIDPALVRHVYDVAHIAEKSESCLKDAQSIFPILVRSDQQEFDGQNPQFDEDPVGVLRRTLRAARVSDELQRRYEQTLIPLVYDSEPPSFEEAFAVFEEIAERFLVAC